MNGKPKSHRAVILAAMYCTHPDNDAEDKLALVCFAVHSNHGTGENSFPGNRNLGEAMMLKDSATDGRLTKLIGRGLIARTAKADGRGKASVYKLCLASSYYPDTTPGNESLIDDETARPETTRPKPPSAPQPVAESTEQTARPATDDAQQQTTKTARPETARFADAPSDKPPGPAAETARFSEQTARFETETARYIEMAATSNTPENHHPLHPHLGGAPTATAQVTEEEGEVASPSGATKGMAVDVDDDEASYHQQLWEQFKTGYWDLKLPDAMSAAPTIGNQKAQIIKQLERWGPRPLIYAVNDWVLDRGMDIEGRKANRWGAWLDEGTCKIEGGKRKAQVYAVNDRIRQVNSMAIDEAFYASECAYHTDKQNIGLLRTMHWKGWVDKSANTWLAWGTWMADFQMRYDLWRENGNDEESVELRKWIKQEAAKKLAQAAQPPPPPAPAPAPSPEDAHIAELCAAETARRAERKAKADAEAAAKAPVVVSESHVEEYV